MCHFPSLKSRRQSLFSKSMITRRDTQQVIELLRELEWGKILAHPEDVFHDRWDYHHFRRLRAMAEARAWVPFVTYLRSCGETCVRETVETLIKRTTLAGSINTWRHDSHAEQHHDRGPLGLWQNPIGGRSVDGATGVSTALDRDGVLLRGIATSLHPDEEKKGFRHGQEFDHASDPSRAHHPGGGNAIAATIQHHGSRFGHVHGDATSFSRVHPRHLSRSHGSSRIPRGRSSSNRPRGRRSSRGDVNTGDLSFAGVGRSCLGGCGQSGRVGRCGRGGQVRGEERVGSGHPQAALSIKKQGKVNSRTSIMRRFHRQLPFLRSVLKEADRHRRRERLQLANADQINAVTELVMNTLRGNVPLSPANYKILLPHRNALRDMARKKNSIKKTT